MAWHGRGCFSWIMEQLGKAGRLEPVEVTKSKCRVRLRLGGSHGGARGELCLAQSPQLMDGQEAAERRENRARNEVKAERKEEQSVRKVWNQLVEEDDVPQTDGVQSMCSSQRGFSFSEGSLSRRDTWK